MPRVRDFLYRFRPAGAPGAVAAAGVPIDRTAELTAELEPLFASLARTERECADIRARADGDAVAIRAHAADRARGLLSAAEPRTAAERAAAAATAQQRTESQAADQMAAAGQEAAAVRQLATSRMPGFVAGVKRLLVRSRTQPTHWRLARLAIDLAVA
jgi:hypothetical protein